MIVNSSRKLIEVISYRCFIEHYLRILDYIFGFGDTGIGDRTTLGINLHCTK